MTRPTRFLTGAILAAGLITFAVGCGKGDGKSEPNAGGATPEDTFKNAQAAAEKEDSKALVANMTGESQEMYAGMMAFFGMMMQGFAGPDEAEGAKKIKEVLEKHGLTEDFLKKTEGDTKIEDPMAGMKKLVEPIKDRGQFVADITPALKGMKGFKDNSPMQKGATLKDVKIEGDSAKGTIEFEKGGAKETAPISFKKVDGKWLMDLTDAMKGSMGPGGPPAGGGLPGELPTGGPGDLPLTPRTGAPEETK